ncbi:hypothetical protein WAI453_002024 [Rhynchosporium graminicola]
MHLNVLGVSHNTEVSLLTQLRPLFLGRRQYLLPIMHISLGMSNHLIHPVVGLSQLSSLDRSVAPPSQRTRTQYFYIGLDE